MERVACVDVPALALQWLLRARPAWRAGPVAVLAREDLQGEVLHCNTAARRAGVAIGMRHGAALAVAPTLQAAVVSAAELKAAVDELLGLLLRRAPRVEPGEAGVFWIDPSGLERLFGDLERWSCGLLAELQAVGFTAGLVIGFHRHRAHALARMVRGARVIASPEAEASLLGQVPLARIDLPPGLLDSLGQLGIHHLAGLLGLPAAELRARFGLAAALVQARYLEPAAALRPMVPREPVTESIEIEPPDDHCERLLFAIRPRIDRVLQRLAVEGEALVGLEVEMELDHHAPTLRTRIEPAAPVGPGEARGLVELLHLRLTGISLEAPVLRVTLTGCGARARAEQAALLGGAGRDLQAAGRALARVRAAFGEQAVTRAQLKPAHLPEAGYRWEPITELTCPKVQDVPANHHEALAAPPLCRRLLPRPRPLAAWSGRDDGTWLASTGLVRGAVIRMDGPHRVSGGWWARTVERDYFYAETSAGDIAWVYHDKARGRWFLHGLLD